MKRSTLIGFAARAISLSLALGLCGCNGDLTQLTFLDLLNTVFLGITAAGGVVLLRNA